MSEESKNVSKISIIYHLDLKRTIYDFKEVVRQMKNYFKEMLEDKMLRLELNPNFKDAVLISQYMTVRLERTIGYIDDYYFDEENEVISLSIVFDRELKYVAEHLVQDLFCGNAKIMVRAFGNERTGEFKLITFDIVDNYNKLELNTKELNTI